MGKRWTYRVVMVMPIAGWLALGPLTACPAASPPRVAGVVAALVGPQVTVISPSASPRPLKVGDRLSWGDAVQTPRDATVRIFLDQRATITVRELSRLQLREEEQATGMWYVLEVLKGKISMSVDRMLLRDQEQDRWRSAVASVRG